MNEEYAEYRCSACKKSIKTEVIACKSCVKLFFHPGCVSKHKIYDKNRELVSCPGPFEKFIISDGDKVADINKAAALAGRTTGPAKMSPATSSGNKVAAASGAGDIDRKIDWLVKTVKELKDETACRKEIKSMIKEIVREEMGGIKQEIEELRKMLTQGACGPSGGATRKYSDVIKERKEENILIIKPKVQQESEITKKTIKDKIDITKMEIGITKLRKGGKGTVILGCETEEEKEKLKATVQAAMGEEVKVSEPQKRKPKIKIINVGGDEMKMEDDELLDTIKKQNRIGEECCMHLVKKILRGKNKDIEQGSVIIEVDECTHKSLINRGKINLGWRKCPIFNYISVRRCFKCWGYYHIAKNCTRQETCYKCAGNHKANECTTAKKRCVNCTYKNQTYNLKINVEHEALDSECPTFKKVLEEEKKRAGWEDAK
ncbi:uncharacterized protein [Temnothorax nylanderi]|uniref:uncharacterized protein n=1 Tax=Temnothorax nylanderi TaxID=102681 RepID=UPI003A8AA0D2